MVAKPYACVTRQGLRVRGCGIVACVVCRLHACVHVGSGSGLGWSAGVGESPVRESDVGVGCHVSRVAAGSWNLL